MIKKSLADHYPELIESWHPHKNSSLTPYMIAPKSNKKVWWQCSQGHEWQALITNRTGVNKTGCPYCAGKKVSFDNNLNVKAPKLSAEWYYAKNDPIKPDNIYYRSTKKVWWICAKGHEWQATPQKRVLGTNCPYCSGRK
jgi:hypothetical protein